jgi:sterol desaturase/sphingolipid hydroxylase (fatty acid hydroxylase superfamily)
MEEKRTTRNLWKNRRGIAAGAMIGVFIIVAIAVVMAFALAQPIFSMWNTTAGSKNSTGYWGGKGTNGIVGVGGMGSPLSAAIIILGYLVAFVFVAAIIVWVVRQLIE